MVPPRSRLLLSSKEVARALGISERHVKNLVYSGALLSITVGRLRRIHIGDLCAYIDKRREVAAQAPLLEREDAMCVVVDRGELVVVLPCTADRGHEPQVNPNPMRPGESNENTTMSRAAYGRRGCEVNSKPASLRSMAMLRRPRATPNNRRSVPFQAHVRSEGVNTPYGALLFFDPIATV